MKQVSKMDYCLSVSKAYRMKNLEKIIDKFSRVRIGVIGDVMLDHFISGDVERISPEAPVPVLAVERDSYVLGGVGNSAANAASLGAKVEIIGIRGDDEAGERLERLFAEKGIDHAGMIVLPRRRTTQKIRIVARGQQVVRLDREDRTPLDAEDEKKILAFLAKGCERWNALLVSDYSKGVITKKIARFLVSAARRLKNPLIVDTNTTRAPHTFAYFRGARVMTPNRKEAEAIVGKPCRTETEIRSAGEFLRRRSGADVVLTRGAEGMTVFEKRGITHVPASAQQVFDVTGAGDTVAATIALALASGALLADAARLANYAAGVVVAKRGTATVSPEELIKHLNGEA